MLEAKGIRVTGGVATSSAPLPAGTRVLAAHESPSMAEMVRVVNKESQNLHAEMLLRLVGLKAGGEGSVEKGHEAVAEIAKRLGVSRTTGWGLARRLRPRRAPTSSPRAASSPSSRRWTATPHAAAFRDSLPIAGVDGTLEKRMRGTAAERRVVAKTGTLRLANALAGYVDDASAASGWPSRSS